MAQASAGQKSRGKEQGHLQQGLERRHMTMISLGGIIGAGLFVGTGPILNAAGPATILTYLLTDVLLFYVVSVFFVAAIVPWNTGFTEDVAKGPFTLTFGEMGIPHAPLIMNLVVLTAVLSVLNSSLYTKGRMLFALTRHNDAPGFLTNTTRRGVPVWAILAGTIRRLDGRGTANGRWR